MHSIAYGFHIICLFQNYLYSVEIELTVGLLDELYVPRANV